MVVGAFIVVMAIVWFIITQILGPVQFMGRGIADSMGGASTQYVLVDQFLTGIISFILAFAIFALAQWVFIYSQRKGDGYS